jgi:nicotinamide mononucleotide transporter
MNPDFLIDFGLFRTSPVELIAVLFGLASVWLVKKESVWAFPIGAVNVLIYVFICFSAKLYAYAGINVFYFLMGMYGWYNWIRKTGTNDHIPITQCRLNERWIYSGLILIFFILLYLMLRRFTDSQVPFWDAITTAIYIIAMWLMARKKIEHWILWILGDLISIWLFAYEKLFFSSFQYLVFTVIASLGWLEWRKKLKPVIRNQ